MPLRRGQKLLRSRYELFRGPIAGDGASETWLAVDEREEEPHLVKAWPFSGDRPDDFQRALWDSELRTLYRVGSSPGADRSLLVVRDAGVDADSSCFAMVLDSTARGYDLLSDALRERSSHAWLSGGDPQARRREIWSGLERVADGLRLLHEQNMLHRDVGADAIFFNRALGPHSFRLGGFEWSLRLGVPATSAPPITWATPPEFIAGEAVGYRPETDWFGFGMLAIRCLLNVENYASNAPDERFARVSRALERVPPRDLSDLERDLLLRLVATDARDRLDKAFEIRTAISDIIARLSYGPEPSGERKPLVLVVNQTADGDIVEHALVCGFVPNEDDPHEPYNANDPLHVARLTQFFQRRLENAQLYAVPDVSITLLVGEGTSPLIIGPFRSFDRSTGEETESWDLAFCYGVGELRRNRGGSECIDLPRAKLVVRSLSEANRGRRALTQTAENWSRYLPTSDQTEQLREHLALFHDFIACTNQIELLIRDSEIFAYEVESEDGSGDGVERIVIRELGRERPPLDLFRLEGGLAEFLQREIESNKDKCRLVALTQADEDALIIRHIDEEECWAVTGLDTVTGRVELERVTAGLALAQAPKQGAIRTWGMFGQVALIRRRKRAIDRLEGHSYLLRSLSAAGQVYMDTGPAPLPFALREDEVDDAKQAAIEDILRVRPIYALQGPPGTGKTTLVAHLLRQLLEDDPVAQILITAQAHGAVDVLREKVRSEAFRDVEEARQPLAIRLGRQDDEERDGEGSVRDVTLSMLEAAHSRLEERDSGAPVERAWRETVNQMIAAIRSFEADRMTPEFFELVKRGANLVYCTTSAGDLEDLADLAQSFDWAILEEAGKAHGFDLALPLQAGHRWLLIGDHRQLPPYRFEDYSVGLAELDRVVEALWALPDRGGGLLDLDWIRKWQNRDDLARAEFINYAKNWLNTFERVFEHCSVAPGTKRITLEEPSGAAAGMLSGQHRMHPQIGTLISRAYYRDQLVNRTTADRDSSTGRGHLFVAPEGIAGKAIVWLDTPYCEIDESFRERGPNVGAPRYTNRAEVEVLRDFVRSLRLAPEARPSVPVELAVLSPYNQQVSLINRVLASTDVPAGVQAKTGLHRRARQGEPRLAHTVDSFQGNQADVIAVSLVRNNDSLPGRGLGFLDQAQRLNVLLSRAERLLVLVGSWEFFERQLIAVSLDDEHHPLWHWKQVLAVLDESFESRVALRVPIATQQAR